MVVDWYRNTDWNEEIEKQFFEKLRRARDKAQYLRIQACTLSEFHPRVALGLLEKFFEIRDTEYDLAQAYVDQATAYEALCKIDDAILSYEKALRREKEFPNSITQAYLELPRLIWENRFASRYKQALEILDQNREQPFFPIDHFRFHSISAFILDEIGEAALAQTHVRRASEAAERTHSGARNHPRLGLVSENELKTLKMLKKILSDG